VLKIALYYGQVLLRPKGSKIRTCTSFFAIPDVPDDLWIYFTWFISRWDYSRNSWSVHKPVETLAQLKAGENVTGKERLNSYHKSPLVGSL